MNLLKEDITKIFIVQTKEDKASGDDSKRTVYINLRFPQHILYDEADKLGTETTLCFNSTSLFIKAPYNNKNKHCFMKFDADEEVEAIESKL